MSKTLIAFGVLTIALLFALGTNDTESFLRSESNAPDTVPFVDPTKYAKKWYEQAVIPFYFERGCSKTTATYSINPDGKTFKVDNECFRNGKLVKSIGKAIPQDQTNSKLKVEFISTLDIGGAYWVVRLGKNYEYSVVSNPKESLLWILSDVPHMDADLYEQIYNDLKQDGFPVDKLRKTEQ